MTVQLLGVTGYVIVNDEDAFHSAYGYNKWTSVQESARIYNNKEDAEKAIKTLEALPSMGWK